MLNDSIRYSDNVLLCDGIPVQEIATKCGTPVYVYSLRRVLANYRRIRDAFAGLRAHIHYSAKANANLAVLRALINAGAGIDAVSAGEIHRALVAGAKPEAIVFAGVGKSPEELRYAAKQGIGWFNVENVDELRKIDAITAELGRPATRVALRLNPDVTANTHPYIATGHGGAKFGLTAETVQHVLAQRENFPHLRFSGIHVHIGSQLHDVQATKQAVEAALALTVLYPDMNTVNIGGGLPVAYAPDAQIPSFAEFAETLAPLLHGHAVLLEPGRAVIADAGILVTRILYVKRQAGQTFYIVDASMTEFIRPMLYGVRHEIVPVMRPNGKWEPVNVVGPVCETTDVLGRDVMLPEMEPGDMLAILTCGAYSMVMASNYNARPRPAEVIVTEDGINWEVGRRRETWDDLLRSEMLD